MDNVPAIITTATTDNTIGTSYDTTCATPRIAPSNENLLRLAHPLMNTDNTVPVLMANTNKTAMFRSTGTNPGATGNIASNNTVGITANGGARK